MKYTTIILFSFSLLVIACKKDSKTTPAINNANNNTTSPYYFKFTLNGLTYNLNANIPQYMPFYANEIGGFEVGDGSLYPSMGLSLDWPLGDTVKESDVMALAGKTLYFNDTTIQLGLIFDSTSSSDTWYSNDTSNTNYNVKITTVTFLKNDTTLGYAVRTYVITGSCTAVMANTTKTSILSTGSFNFIISRRDL